VGPGDDERLDDMVEIIIMTRLCHLSGTVRLAVAAIHYSTV